MDDDIGAYLNEHSATDDEVVFFLDCEKRTKYTWNLKKLVQTRWQLFGDGDGEKWKVVKKRSTRRVRVLLAPVHPR